MVQPNYRHWPPDRLMSWKWGQAVPALPLLSSLCLESSFGLGSARVGSCAALPVIRAWLLNRSTTGLQRCEAIAAPLRSFLLRFEAMPFYQFSNDVGEAYGSCQVFCWDRFDCQDAGLIERDSESATGWVCWEFGVGGTFRIETEPELWEGWYWQACFPECLPDGDPMGPFESEPDAMSDSNCI